MDLLQIFTTVAALASIVGLALHLFKNKQKKTTYFFIVISFILLIMTTIFWNKNIEMQKAKTQADKLYKSWTKINDFASTGEFRGIIISGMAFLETNKKQFPEAYELIKSYIHRVLISSDKKKYYMGKRIILKEAAETMVSTVKTIRLE